MTTPYRSLLGHEQGARHIHVHMTELDVSQAGPHYQHIHAAEEAVYVLEGRVRYTFAGRTHECGPGDLVFFPPNVPHAEVEYLSPRLKYLVIRSVEPGDEPCCCGKDRPPDMR
ncbi:MAG: cupin domain-containing protein [Planctomycetes bacterium]|nr:cupin domain-containing protein [Planctomycetota bacterium]